MARGACTFKRRDVTRALKATQTAGLNVQRIEIDKHGKIVVVTREIIDQGPQPEGNEWDNLYATCPEVRARLYQTAW